MSWLRAMRAAALRFLPCRHVDADGRSTCYRERRRASGVEGILHLVCERCGHAAPAVQRTAEEHAQALRSGAVRQQRAKPVRKEQAVTRFRRRT